METALRTVRDAAPYAYQVTEGGLVEVDVAFSLSADGTTVSYAIGAYNPDLELVIDPQLAWGTFLGGAVQDWGASVATDTAGYVYVAGGTYSADFPAGPGWDVSHNGDADTFVAKFAPDGSPVWCTFIGGGWEDGPGGMVVVDGAYAYVSGYTDSPDFPAVGGFDTSHNGGRDVYVACFGLDGGLLWSTFLGGAQADRGFSIEATDDGHLYVCGLTHSDTLPAATNGHAPDGARADGFVCKLGVSGALVWSTYLGGSHTDEAHGLLVDDAGRIFVSGSTLSTDFPSVLAYDSTKDGDRDTFVARLTPDAQVLWATYLGGDGYEEDTRLTQHPQGGILVSGGTGSANFPAVGPGSEQNHGEVDWSLAHFSVDGALLWSTCFGGDATDFPWEWRWTPSAPSGSPGGRGRSLCLSLTRSTRPTPGTPTHSWRVSLPPGNCSGRATWAARRTTRRTRSRSAPAARATLRETRPPPTSRCRAGSTQRTAAGPWTGSSCAWTCSCRSPSGSPGTLSRQCTT